MELSSNRSNSINCQNDWPYHVGETENQNNFLFLPSEKLLLWKLGQKKH